MQNNNTTVKILITIIILLVIGGGWYISSIKSSVANPQPSQSAIPAAPALSTYKTPTALAQSSGIEFVFEYPEEYMVRDGSWYTTPGGGTYPFAKVMRVNEQKDENYVTISSKTTMSTANDLVCDSSYSKCKEFGNYIVFTKSKDAYVLDLFEVIVKNIKFNPTRSR